MKLPLKELEQLLLKCPEAGSTFRHYKTGGIYRVVGAAISESTQEPLVIYRPLDSFVRFARPLKEWDEPIVHEGRTVIRFERIR